eukprot:8668442-Prorocentrum_lima.AAC.1
MGPHPRASKHGKPASTHCGRADNEAPWQESSSATPTCASSHNMYPIVCGLPTLQARACRAAFPGSNMEFRGKLYSAWVGVFFPFDLVHNCCKVASPDGPNDVVDGLL